MSQRIRQALAKFPSQLKSESLEVFTCPKCALTIDETQELWDKWRASGTCPRCPPPPVRLTQTPAGDWLKVIAAVVAASLGPMVIAFLAVSVMGGLAFIVFVFWLRLALPFADLKPPIPQGVALSVGLIHWALSCLGAQLLRQRTRLGLMTSSLLAMLVVGAVVLMLLAATGFGHSSEAL